MRPGDIAYTPKAVAEQAVEEVVSQWGIPGSAVDVGAGRGAISKALEVHMYPDRIIPIEPRRECAQALEGYPNRVESTIQEWMEVDRGQYDLVIANPAFSLIAEIAPLCLRLAGQTGEPAGYKGVVCLLGLLDWGQRCTSLQRHGSPTHRAVWIETPPTHCWRIPGSLSMSAEGSGDARSYCWWIWAPGPRPHPTGWITTTLPCLPGPARRVTAEETNA